MILDSGLPEHVDDLENVVRFLTSSSQFNASFVKPSAFMPNPMDNRTSVFRHDPEPVDALWALGYRHISGRRIHGAAILTCASVRAALLDVKADEPPPQHANICGWPDPELEKAIQKERALILSRAATLYKAPAGE